LNSTTPTPRATRDSTGASRVKALKNPSRWLDNLALKAPQALTAGAGAELLPIAEIEEDCAILASWAASRMPLADPAIGFDRPTNVYIVSQLVQAGGHRVLLEQLVAARPRERHVVLFTGLLTDPRNYGVNRIREIGALPLLPDSEGTLYERYLWLRNKLGAYAAQRVFLLHHPEDVLAAAAAIELAPRFGQRMYMMRHADTVPTLCAGLEGVTHVAIRPEQAERIRAEHPALRVVDLPLSQDPPSVSTRHNGDYRPEFFANGTFTTASSGGAHKFPGEGAMSFPQIVPGILRATRGRHIHIGTTDSELMAETFRAMEAAGLPRDRMIFIGDVASVAQALHDHRVDLFVSSFPIGGGLSVTEAASVGLPIAVHDPGGDDDHARYIAGATHRPREALSWTRPSELFDFLRHDADDESLGRMARSSMEWYRVRLSPDRFRRRLAALLRCTEAADRPALAATRDAAVRELFDGPGYLDRYPDIAASGLDPLDHFMRYGEVEGRRGSILFDAAHYLAQLTPAEAKLAADSPMAHYVCRGEPMGLRPHPLFDPELHRSRSGAPDGEARPISQLGRYLASDGMTRPHMLFDPAHYVQQLAHGDDALTPLEHYLTIGGEEGLSPHPLILPHRFPGNPIQAVLSWIGQAAPSPNEVSPHPLFDPQHFAKDDPHGWKAAAPNLLWAHLIAGNQRHQQPHALISTNHIARANQDILAEAQTVLHRIVDTGFDGDTHPLVRATYIQKQAPWLGTTGANPTRYFLEYGASHNIDPHPYFSTQYYLHNNADVARTGANPLVHYLTNGQYEGRLPHPFFDGNHYYRAFLQNRDTAEGPLTDYIVQGAGAFRHTQPSDPALDRLRMKTARRLFRLGDGEGAAQMLLDATHPDTAARHPTLICETRDLAGVTVSGGAGGDDDLAPARKVTVRRPSIVHPKHLAPKAGSYEADAIRATMMRDVTVIPGNDGIITDSGEWWDPGLAHFDGSRMTVKEFGALVDTDNRRALIRRHSHSTRLRTGILACGTYSHNYYHFLIEVLPRAMSAAMVAPPDVPILADDHMPAQHFQALRNVFPQRPIRRLTRGYSYDVEELYVSNMANLVHDVLDQKEAPTDAVRYHPDILKWLNSIGNEYRTDGPLKKLYFRRTSGVRRLLNWAEIEAGLLRRGFEVIQCEGLSFSDQVRLAANAEVIVGQSGGHLANIVFARPGTEVFTLYSNAAGTNYYLWDGIGSALDLKVRNVVGWRIAGSAQGTIADVHEDFTVPPHLVMPFFPRPEKDEMPAETMPDAEALRTVLTLLHDANNEADTLTAAWTIRADWTPDGFEARLLRLRRRAGELLGTVDGAALRSILAQPLFADHGRSIRSGLHALRDHDADEARLVERLTAQFRAMAEHGWQDSREEAENEADDAPDADDGKVIALSTARDAATRAASSRNDGREAPRFGKAPGDGAAGTRGETSSKSGATAGPDSATEAMGIDAPADSDEDRLRRLLALSMLYLPVRDLPLLDDISALPQDVVERYLTWLASPPFLFRKGDDAAYVDFAERLLTWFDDQLSRDIPADLRSRLIRTVSDIDLGQLFLVDAPVRHVAEARNRLLERLAIRSGTPRRTLRDPGGSEGRIRVGILCRTFDKGPDSEAIVAFFKAFDATRYEIFAYSVGFRDRVVSDDPDFAREFDEVIHHRRILTSNPRDIRSSLLDDDLDVFIHANATTYGIRAQELALYHRIAPIQLLANSHVPMSLGFPSFDGYITGRSDDPAIEVDQAHHAERLLRRPGPVICYLHSLKPRPDPLFDRAALGFSDDDVVLMNAGSLSKLRHDCLHTMLSALKQVPQARLLLAPYNPGWVARSQAFAFNRQLRDMCEELSVDPARIVVMGELSVAEAESALALCDIYLNPFPHGGATMTHLALINGKPPITLRRRSSRSIDQFLIASMGFEELLASTPEEYLEKVRRLAENRETCQKLSRRMLDAAKSPAFVDNPDYSQDMQAVIDELIADWTPPAESSAGNGERDGE